MRRHREKGFILILVIMTLAAISTAIYILTAHANTMLFQSDTAHLRATQRNLTASALTWAGYNIKNQNTQALNKTENLDTTNITNRPATLTITIDAPENSKPQAQITTSTTRKRRTLKSSDKYTLTP